jgi:hypothetical protein
MTGQRRWRWTTAAKSPPLSSPARGKSSIRAPGEPGLDPQEVLEIDEAVLTIGSTVFKNPILVSDWRPAPLEATRAPLQRPHRPGTC